ncbi:hypothetical protein AB0G15_05605 [Streptosporangium sp. NPDC023825]|uniref:hypothetical protein n=1 Tax=Streptosporangium sp. NPDC023825 TaxID=3154909 RepID=UPI00342F9CF4
MNTSDVPIIGEKNEATTEYDLHTAFVVFVDRNGAVGVTPDPQLLAEAVSITRPASGDEMYGAMASAMGDLDAQRAALNVHSLMTQQARAMANAQETARLAVMVNNSKRG